VLEESVVSLADLEAALRAIIAEHLHVIPERLTHDTQLDDLGLDDDATALGVIEAVEDVLEVRFPDDFLDGVYTYGDLSTAMRVAVGG
jgi:acyl carrier protein